MSTLASLQQRFAEAIVKRDAQQLAALVSADRDQLDGRAAVYFNNHHIGLKDALVAVYPVIRRLLGEDCFALLGRDHIDATPKPSGNLLDFGASFAAFIGTRDGLAALPYLADVARLEWLQHRLFHAPNPTTDNAFCLQRLAQLDAASLAAQRLHLAPWAQLFSSEYPILRIWQVNQRSGEADQVALDEGGVMCLLSRPGLQLRTELLARAEFAFLAALERHTLLHASEQALAADPQFDLTAALLRWQHLLIDNDRATE